MPKTPSMNRREFVALITTLLGSMMGAVIGLPAISYLISPSLKTSQNKSWISLGTLQNYPINKPTLFSFTRSKINGWEKTVNSYGVFVNRESESKVRVFSNICTHLSCRVNWKPDQEQFVCPCHDGHFDIHGQVVAGPPPRPMDEYEVKVEKDNLLIHFKES